MTNGAQRVHFALVEVLFRFCAPVQLLLVDFLCTIKSTSRLVPNLEYLRNPAILIIGRLEAPDYLIHFGELYRIPRADRSLVISSDALISSISSSDLFIAHFCFLSNVKQTTNLIYQEI